MCKLFMVTGSVNKQTQEQLLFAINGSYAFGQRDGFGFVSAGHESVARGRYLNPQSYFGFRGREILPEFMRRESVGEHEQGQLPSKAYTLIAHGRTSTNTVCLPNVHPFHDEESGVYLAHNGTCYWQGSDEDEPKSANNCDTEAFFNWLLAGGSWRTVSDYWSGFGAFMIVDTRQKITMIAQHNARLSGARRRCGDGWVFATDDGDLTRICAQAGIVLATRPIDIPPRLMVFDQSGKMVEDRAWSGFAQRDWSNSDHLAIGNGSNGAGFQSNGNGKYRKSYKHNGHTVHVSSSGERTIEHKGATVHLNSENQVTHVTRLKATTADVVPATDTGLTKEQELALERAAQLIHSID